MSENEPSTDFEEEHRLKQERLNFFVRLTERCYEVISELDTNSLHSQYARNESSMLDYYLFTYLSDRTLFLEVVAKFNPSQLDNIGSYHFRSHPDFEKVIHRYTKISSKPNQILEKSRPWDVALNLVMKVEALEPNLNCYYRRLLRREYAILQHIWNSHLQDVTCSFEDMTGIPMIFDYKEIPSQRFVLNPGVIVEEIDMHGMLVQKMPNSQESTLAYMTMEKLGPSLSYLIDLMCAAKRQSIGLTVCTAFKIFDQLVCRLLQIHRFGVVHNGICPRNIYFGRNMCSNVIYINNFRASTLVSSKTGTNPSVNMLVAKDVRFAPLNMMLSTKMHPVDDLESAFYTLLASIGHSLPWDALIPLPNNELFHQSEDTTNLATQQNAKMSAIMNNPASPSTAHRRSFFKAIRESKTAFWESKIHLERLIANIMNRLTDKESEFFPLIAGILHDLYSKVKQILAAYSSNINSAEYSEQLRNGSSIVQMYMELRRPVLKFFVFDEVPKLLRSTPVHKGHSPMSEDPKQTLFGWNMSDWCFNCAEIRTKPGTMLLKKFSINQRTIETPTASCLL